MRPRVQRRFVICRIAELHSAKRECGGGVWISPGQYSAVAVCRLQICATLISAPTTPPETWKAVPRASVLSSRRWLGSDAGGLEPPRLGNFSLRFKVLPLPVKRHSEIVMENGAVGIELERPLIATDCLVQTLLGHQRVAQVGEGFHGLRIRLQRPLVMLDRLVELSATGEDA